LKDVREEVGDGTEGLQPPTVTPVFLCSHQPTSSRPAYSITAVPTSASVLSPTSARTCVNGRNTMVIEQPPCRYTAALLYPPIAALSHPSHRSHTASRVTGPSSSSGHHSNNQPTV